MIVYVFYAFDILFLRIGKYLADYSNVKKLSIEVDPKNTQKLELLKQHYHELIEAKNKEIIENEDAQERLQKSMRVILK